MDPVQKSPRQHARIECRAKTLAGGALGEIRSISLGGAYIATRSPLSLGSRLELEFKLPDGTAVAAVGEVRRVTRSTDPGVAIRFVRMNSEGHVAIARLASSS